MHAINWQKTNSARTMVYSRNASDFDRKAMNEAKNINHLKKWRVEAELSKAFLLIRGCREVSRPDTRSITALSLN